MACHTRAQGAQECESEAMTRNHAPATLRNREPIREVLAQELGEGGLLLEIAASTGEHAAYLSHSFPHWQWQPTDPDPNALASIAAWREEGGGNLLSPKRLDAAFADWPLDSADAILCVNMTHISPPSATEGLFAGASRLLTAGAPLIIYGPFFEAGVATAPSNRQFDESLKSRDASWGLRDVEWLDKLADDIGFERTARHEMPANNLTLVYRIR
ncbi:DUF938 domain-containing protein [Aurantiacibacter poecillastricola]|uniref:DUF938 domain-containing protein n=1 Tax=Aurantiacibacter poecillastricola TaxID=3064385 RepID=UPI00273F5EB6|nr:DUF938 domain-containing protein [Aurantiacibacter sp. 219JJ12-13]MDP5262581.1 DUF938 domain-containing protein [Aurantiacibacter sp. 219JJ12-13]